MARLARWDSEGASERYWRKDPGFWPAATPQDVATRLGWLTLTESMGERLAAAQELVYAARDEGVERLLLLGMGGSSLAPEVFAQTWGAVRGAPRLEVLDSTHPAAVRAAESAGRLDRTWFIVSSKSGSTLEPNSFFEYFWSRLSTPVEKRGRQFLAITDPGSPLETLAKQHQFRHCFLAPPDVGGRYSALTEFGLVPAAIAGVDVRQLLQRAREMAESCSPAVPASKHPGFQLGAALGELAVHGRDKVTFVVSPALSGFPAWAEQLIAESTGKTGKGIVPVAGEVAPFEATNSRDRVVVELRFRSEEARELDTGAALAGAAGVPVLRFALDDLHELGAEFFRWEFAVAAAGVIVGIDPFDQPDVELAKELARRAMSADAPAPSGGVVALPVGPSWEYTSGLARWLAEANVGDYVAIQAFLAPSDRIDEKLRALRSALRRRLRVSTTLGYGPRFLHSTGQLHKGGPASGLFLQLVDEPSEALELPAGHGSFGKIIRAQADGDAQALEQKGRRLFRVQLGRDPISALESLTRSVASGP
ncbi:MAG TPA: glucose-6-phosphate isomerase [Thermoplasmata archaeon]|nr:glucose-6-phosphate isomerase [Thermoplasmata archaeon]